MAKIKIDSKLYDRAKKFAELEGYSGIEEFICSVIEEKIALIDGPADQKAVHDQLRGLGYIE